MKKKKSKNKPLKTRMGQDFREERVTVLYSVKELKELRANAKKAGLILSDYMRKATL